MMGTTVWMNISSSRYGLYNRENKVQYSKLKFVGQSQAFEWFNIAKINETCVDKMNKVSYAPECVNKMHDKQINQIIMVSTFWIGTLVISINWTCYRPCHIQC